MDQANIAVIKSTAFSFDPVNNIYSIRSASLGSDVDIFSKLDSHGNRGFILKTTERSFPVVLKEFVRDDEGWIYYPFNYEDNPIAVFINNT